MPKEIIAQLLAKSAKLKKNEIVSLLEIPPNQELGDFSFPCFKLVAEFKQSPVEIAKSIAKELKLKKPLTRVEAKGPYLNFFIERGFEAEEILSQVTSKYGETKIGKNQKIIIDFSGPNVGKPMHIGHIRSTIVGDSLMRIHHYLGYDTMGINYLGDIGLHIGKLIVAWELWLDKKALKKDPIQEMLRLYVKFCKLEKSEMSEGTDETDYEGNEWTDKAKEKLKLIELGDKKTHKMWQDITEHSGIAFKRVYDILDVNFNETTGQSKFSEKGKEMITLALKKGQAKIENDGAVFVEFENLPKRYVLRSNGTASYITQDLGAAVERYKKYKFDQMIYVTDFRQNLHFQQLFEILKKFGFDFYDKCSHVGFGTVNFGKEVIATRTGQIILLEDVLNKTIEKAGEEIKKRKTKGDKEKIGVGAIKYAILKSEPIRDIEFSWEQALNFEGDSGPYLQYSYARASSIMKKSKKKPSLKIPEKIDAKEIAMIKKIAEFPQIIEDAAANRNPSAIAHYAFQLSQDFNEFYHACPVIGSKEEEFRLKIIESFRITLKNSLYLLGIEVMEEM